MTDRHPHLALVAHWRDCYNDDVARMVDECYAADCTVHPMGLAPIHGAAALHRVERSVLASAPRRRLRIERCHADGDTVCVEATLLDPDRGDDWALPFVAVLTFREGRIVSDRTYADWRHWPGL
jgi:limonene-1,2-epoxide hydrolase